MAENYISKLVREGDVYYRVHQLKPDIRGEPDGVVEIRAFFCDDVISAMAAPQESMRDFWSAGRTVWVK